MASWSRALDLQLVELLQKHRQEEVWSTEGHQSFPWKTIFKLGRWPEGFTEENIQDRWQETYRRWVPHEHGKRAKRVEFRVLREIIERHDYNKRMSGAKRKDSKSVGEVAHEKKAPRSEEPPTPEQTYVISWLAHLDDERTRQLYGSLLVGDSELDLEEVFGLLSHGQTISAESLNALARVLTPTEAVLLMSDRERILVLIRGMLWIISVSTENREVPVELRTQVRSVSARVVSSLLEAQFMALSVLIAPSDPRADRLLVATHLLRLSPSLRLLPFAEPLPLPFGNVLDALPSLQFPLPTWFDVFRRYPDDVKHLIAALRESFSILLVIERLDRGLIDLTWPDLAQRLLIVVESESRYGGLLRLEQSSSSQLLLSTPAVKSISRVRVDGRALAERPGSTLMFTRNVRLLELSLSRSRVRIVCGASLSTGCSAREVAQSSYALDEVLRRLDLQRHEVPRDGHCLLRALLLATGSAESVNSLLNRIWQRAKSSAFQSDLLTEEQRQELNRVSDPMRALLSVSFAASGAPSEPVFATFWDVVYLWAAPEVQRDILLLTDEARACTLFPRDGNHSEFALGEIARRLQVGTAVALLHYRSPLHVDWLSAVAVSSVDSSLQTPTLTLTSGLELPSPIVPAPRRSSTRLPLKMVSPRAQLEALQKGDRITLTTSENGWWSSWDALLQRFVTATGDLVWYARDPTQPHRWQQHPIGQLPRDCPLPATCTLNDWVKWHDQVKPEDDLFYLVNVEIPNEELNRINAAIPLLAALDDRTSPCSLHFYLRKRFPNLAFPDLRPRLYFAPGLVRGAISTPLHLDGLGHMTSYHWFLGFDPEALNLVQVYPSEELLGSERWATLRQVASGAMAPSGLTLPHSISHMVDASLPEGCDESAALRDKGIEPHWRAQLKSGELMFLPAGFPHAFKKWSSPNRRPLVSFAGDIAWLGYDEENARKAIKLMLRVEARLEKSYCLPEMSLLACLLEDGQAAHRAADDCQVAHRGAAADVIRPFLEEERKRLPSELPISPEALAQKLHVCDKCNKLLHNAMVSDPSDTFYCLSCFSRQSAPKTYARKRSLAQEERRERVAFQFGHPAELLKRLPPSAPRPQLKSTDLITLLSQVARQQRLLIDHSLCQAALDAGVEERVLRLQENLLRFCHTDEQRSTCPLLATAKIRALTFEQELRPRQRCRASRCNKTATWREPLYHCFNDPKHSPFHLACAGYPPELRVPYECRLLCPNCLANQENVRTLHLWESITAPAELYREGFRLVDVPRDGLCFFSVLYLLTHKVRSAEARTVYDWFIGRPFELLLQASGEPGAAPPLRAAHQAFVTWRSLPLERISDLWRKPYFNELCSVLPKKMEEAGLLAQPFLRYSYSAPLRRGFWSNSDGSKLSDAPDKKIRFAVFHTETPIPHYTLLERHPEIHVTIQDLQRLELGGWLNDSIVNDYLQQILAPKYPSFDFLSSFFYTKLSGDKTEEKRETLRWLTNIALTSSEMIFIPVHLVVHWTLLVVDLKNQRIEYYDSLGSGGETVAKTVAAFLELYFQERNFSLTPPTSWSIVEPDTRPKQSNGSDCGVFICAYARCRCEMDFNSFDFQTSGIDGFRRELQSRLLEEM